MKPNISLIKQAVLAKQANKRQSTAHTKTRGEVSGGGRKPWRQKGTGRARAGSSRSPIWVGGGITFGPRAARNFKKALPKKMATAAKKQLWQLLFDQNQLKRVEKLSLKEPRTKLAIKLLETLEVGPKDVLLVTAETQPELILGTANLPKVAVMRFKDLSILDLVAYKTIVLEASCYDELFPAKKTTEKPVKATKTTTAKKSTKSTKEKA